jgi:putative ABC transport system substrate-binding protein
MRRREFISLIGGAATVLPFVAEAQQAGGMRRIGLLLTLSEDDPETKAGLAAFWQVLQRSGWHEGRNVRIEYRTAEGDAERIRKYVGELLALSPDVICALGTANTGHLLQATRTVPIVFAYVADPVGAGFVESLARPGGNATGFVQFEYGLSAKWLELLKEIAPGLTRAAVLRDATISSGIGQWGAIQTAAPSFHVEVSPVNVSDPREIERAVANFSKSPNGGLIVTASALAAVREDIIIALAARYKLPAVYFLRRFVVRDGLMSFGPDIIDQYRGAANYVDRILKGEKPADLPVQAPTKYELVINLKTAKALGLTVPQSLLARADQVIE